MPPTKLTPEEIQRLAEEGRISPETAAQLARPIDGASRPTPGQIQDLAGKGLIGPAEAEKLRVPLKPLSPDTPAKERPGRKPPFPSKGVSEVAALREKVMRQNQERDQRITEAMVGSSVLASPAGLIPAARLPEQYQNLRGPNGERPIGMDPRKLSTDDLVSIGFSPEEAAQLAMRPAAAPVVNELDRKRTLAVLAMGGRDGR